MKRFLQSIFAVVAIAIVTTMQVWATPPAACAGYGTSPDCFVTLLFNDQSFLNSDAQFQNMGYADATASNPTLTVTAGEVVDFESTGYYWLGGTYMYACGVSILADFNQDGDFEDEYD